MNSLRPSPTMVCVALLILGSHLASAQRFVHAPIYNSGVNALAAVSSDFNGDGNVDLAFLGGGNSAMVTIRLGAGDGKFTAGQALTLSVGGDDIITGDWNRDGVLDLAVAFCSSKEISILLGNGDGTFTMGGAFDSGVCASALATGDLNGDGIPDIAGNQSVVLGNGDGTFAAPIRNNSNGDAPTLADVNSDGKLDLVGTGSDTFFNGNMEVLLGNGDGTFQSRVLYDASTGAGGRPVVADFNHDGVLDVAVGGTQVSVYIGNGDGSFQPQITYTSTPFGSYSGVVGADLNKDGNLDLLTVQGDGNLGGTMLGNADGSFKTASLFGTGPFPIFLTVADFNNDGKLDVAVPDRSDPDFVELLGDGTGKFAGRHSYAVNDVTHDSIAIAAGFLDSDTNLDLAVIDGVKVVLLPGNKNGAFRVGTTYSLGGKAPNWIAVADLNADGKNDVITADTAMNSVSVLLGNGNGTLQNGITYATGKSPVFVAAVDVNGDGKLDLLTANAADNTFSVLLASGSGYATHVDYTATSPRQLAFGDFNRDGKIDLISAGQKGSAQVFLGSGTGTFSAGVTLKPGTVNVSPAVGDLNNDGKLDLVLADSGSTVVYSYLGNGDGTFGSQMQSTARNKAEQISLADFDKDGKLDVMMSAGVGVTATSLYLPGKGDGSFRTAQSYTIDYGPPKQVVGDFNSDGFLDVAMTSGLGGTVTVLLNTGAK